MRQLAVPQFTHARVAEVRALMEHVAGRARRPLGTVAAEAKRLTQRRGRRHFDVGILAVRLGAAVLGKVQAVRRPLDRKVVRQVAVLPAGTVALEEEGLADGHLVGVVQEAAGGPFRARA